MRRSLVLFGFALLLAGCNSAAKAPLVAPAPVVHADVAPAPALATACRAQPSTVYGDEPVVFEIDAASSTQVEVELLDQQDKAVARQRLPAPGQWRPADVPSGDFRLRLGSNPATCRVTVNRELVRATQTER